LKEKVMISRENVCVAAGVVLLLVLAGSSPVMAQATCPFTVTGSLAPGDLTSNPRLFRDEPPNACGANQPCATSACAACALDVYTLATTPGPNPACVQVTVTTPCVGTQFVHASAWLGTFAPPFVCNANFLGDIGASPDLGAPKSFSFNVPPATTFSVVINETIAAAGCPTYQIDVTGCENTPVELIDLSVHKP
jgi:hypothetical protein